MREFFEKLYPGTLDEFLTLAEGALLSGRRLFVVTANPEIFVCGERDDEVRRLLLSEDTVAVADSIGMVKAARSLGYPVAERIAGVDLADRLLDLADRRGLSVALLGAKPEVLSSLEGVLRRDRPGVRIIAARDGYSGGEEEFLRGAASSGADLCLVALGVPRQEKLIYKELTEFHKGVLMGVGGSFDVLSGVKKRAPALFRRLNLEWLYRVAREPVRIGRLVRYHGKFLRRVAGLRRAGRGAVR